MDNEDNLCGSNHSFTHRREACMGAGEMAQQLSALAALPEDPS